MIMSTPKFDNVKNLGGSPQMPRISLTMENFVACIVCLHFSKLSCPFENHPPPDYIHADWKYGSLSIHGKLASPSHSTHK